MHVITQSYNLCRIEPVPAGFDAHLSYERREHDRMTNKTMTHREALSINGVFPVGLFHRAVTWLDSAGHKWEYVVKAQAPMPVPDFTVVGQLRERQDTLLLAVAGNYGGLITGGTGVGKSFIICQICKMYPTLRIGVVSARKSVVETIYERLKPELKDVGLFTGDSNMPGTRVQLATIASVMKTDIKKWDLMLFDEAHNCGYNQTASLVAYAGRARRFGLTATPKGRGDGADMVITALFGPVLADIPYDEAVSDGLVTPIEVRMLSTEGVAFDTTKQQMASRKRACYWRNSGRNKIIAEVAQSVPAEEQLLIMVETLEHALYLSHLLPDYQIVHYGKVEKGRIIKKIKVDDYALRPDELRLLRLKFETGELMRAIATKTWAEGVREQSSMCW